MKDEKLQEKYRKEVKNKFQLLENVEDYTNVWSPDFWNLYREKVMREIENEPGITVGGHNRNHLRYADDTILATDSSQKLQSLLDKVVAVSSRVGLSLNCKK